MYHCFALNCHLDSLKLRLYSWTGVNCDEPHDDDGDDDIGGLILMYHGHGVTNAILVQPYEDHSL